MTCMFYQRQEELLESSLPFRRALFKSMVYLWKRLRPSESRVETRNPCLVLCQQHSESVVVPNRCLETHFLNALRIINVHLLYQVLIMPLRYDMNASTVVSTMAKAVAYHAAECAIQGINFPLSKLLQVSFRADEEWRTTDKGYAAYAA